MSRHNNHSQNEGPITQIAEKIPHAALAAGIIATGLMSHADSHETVNKFQAEVEEIAESALSESLRVVDSAAHSKLSNHQIGELSDRGLLIVDGEDLQDLSETKHAEMLFLPGGGKFTGTIAGTATLEEVIAGNHRDESTTGIKYDKTADNNEQDATDQQITRDFDSVMVVESDDGGQLALIETGSSTVQFIDVNEPASWKIGEDTVDVMPLAQVKTPGISFGPLNDVLYHSSIERDTRVPDFEIFDTDENGKTDIDRLSAAIKANSVPITGIFEQPKGTMIDAEGAKLPTVKRFVQLSSTAETPQYLEINTQVT